MPSGIVDPVDAAMADKKNDNDAELKPEKVNAAIEKGVRYLLEKQQKDGSFSGMFQPSYPMGHTALAVCTLLKCGVPANHPSVAAAFDFLSKQKAVQTYSVGCMLLALEAKYYNTANLDRFAKKKDLTTEAACYAGFKPKISPEDQNWAAQLAQILIDAQTSTGSWTYQKPTAPAAGKASKTGAPPPEVRTDNSNMQYAMMGLKAASRLGVKIPPEVFIKHIQFLATAQAQNGDEIDAFLIPAAHLNSYEYSKELSSESWTEPTRKKFIARGWSYTPPAASCTGSMTAAGLTSAIICKSELMNLKEFNKQVRPKIDVIIEDGCAWLSKYFSVSGNPYVFNNVSNTQKMYHLYFLYGLERVGALSGLKQFAGHDWYKEGALLLLKKQQDDGSWIEDDAMKQDPRVPPYISNTCFALLFLKRATVSVIENEEIFTGDGLLKPKKEEKPAEPGKEQPPAPEGEPKPAPDGDKKPPEK
jgi:hypothetical protein